MQDAHGGWSARVMWSSICPTDPNFGIDLYVATDLQTMTRVWMGEMPVALAIRTGLIELEGRPEFRKCFERWLGLSAYANIADSREHAEPPETVAVDPTYPTPSS